MVIKFPMVYSSETEKLLEREKNYSEIKCFYIPKYYGKLQGKGHPVIEFINGKILSNINDFNLEYKDKITIIFQLIIIFYYLHENGFIYRDLKPNNIIIDKYKRVFLIDFDRMIKYTDFKNYDKFTWDFSSNFMEPEVLQGYIRYENDIYSLTQMFFYVLIKW